MAIEDRQLIQHLRTSGITAPPASAITDGEIALSMDNTNPKIFFKKNNGEFAEFVDKQYVDKKTIKALELVNITPSSAITIDPYKMNNLGTLSGSTTISFNTSAEISGYCAEYSIMFVAGASCAVTLPNGVKYNGGVVPTYVTDRTYEINICNGLAVVGEFY